CRGIAGGGAVAHDLAGGIHRARPIEAAAAECAEVPHPAGCRPRKRMRGRIAIDSCADAHDLAAVIDPVREATTAAERAEVDRPAGCGPRKCTYPKNAA